MSKQTKKSNRPNLVLNLGESSEKININGKEETKKDNKYENKYNLVGSQSIEFMNESVIFKKDNISVGLKGIKELNTGQFVSVVDPNDFELGEYIGAGASGKVHLAKYKPSGIAVAIKSINIYDKNKRKQFKNDLKVLSANDCELLVKFYGAFFETGNVKLVLEYMDLGSLDKVILKVRESKQLMPESVLSKITQEILGGLVYLHKVKHQMHRDIKPANILINSDGIVKLTDFGIAKTLENTEDLSSTFVGTKNYMSPERILGQEYSFSSDIWSLGLVVFELATGLFPYNFSKVYIEHVESILKDSEPTLPDNGIYSPELQNFLTRCLKKNPLERDSAAELSAHPWILKYSDEDANVALWLAELYGNMIID